MLVFYAIDERAPEAQALAKAAGVRIFIRNPRYFDPAQIEGDGALVLVGSPRQNQILAEYENRGLFAARVRDRIPPLPAGVTEGKPLSEDRFIGVQPEGLRPEPEPPEGNLTEAEEAGEADLPQWPPTARIKSTPEVYLRRSPSGPHAETARAYVEAGRGGG